MNAQQRAARERKQKIFVAVGGIVLLGLLAIQLPRLLGGSESTAAETTAATETTATGEVVPPADVAVPVAVKLTDTDPPLQPAPGQLRSFSTFALKDPFVQQLVLPEDAAEDGGGANGGAGGAGEGRAGGSPGGEDKTPKAPQKGFTVGGTSSAAAVTIISVNGARQALAPGAAFPAADPVFVLVAERPADKAVVVGVAGGEYASGDRTATLKLGKPLVLVNTATGARYRLALVAVGNGAATLAKPTRQTPSEDANP